LEDHERALQRVIEENADKALGNLRERRRRAALARQTALARTASRSAAFAHSAKCRLAQARAQGLVKSRRLLLQGADATRRLQELLHECIGEYEKARLRGARSRRLSAEACETVLRGKILDLRWSRFCSRLEDDALGLVKAYDMGNPAGPAQHPGSHGRRTASVSSALAADAAGARSVASLLDPLLASCGLSDSRILRVVALCPCSGSVTESGETASNGGGGGGGSSGSDLRSKDSEQRASLAKGLFGCGRTSSRRRRRAGAGAGGVEAALLGNGGASSPVSVVAENSRLGVADTFRKAVLCGNPGLVAALSCGDEAEAASPVHRRRSSGGGGSASTGSLARPRAAAGSRRSSILLGGGHSGAGKGVGKGDRRGGGGGGGGGSGSLSEGEGEAPFQALLSKGSGNGDEDADGGDDGNGGGGEHCTVVGSAPGLLLSSSHLLWTLQPPFGATEDDARLLIAGDDETDGGSRGDDGGAGRNCGYCGDIGVGDANSNAPRQEGDVEAGPAAGGMHAWDGPRGRVGVESEASRGGSRRQRLAQDLAWLGAAPVGSRVYYCLEEAEWEASRRRKNSVRRETSGCRAQRRKSRRHPVGPDPPEDTAAGEQRERSRAGTGAGGRAGGVPRMEWRRQNGTDADERKEAAAMVFAKSVSGMLAEAYLGGEKARPGQENRGELHAERAEKGSRGVAAVGSGNGARNGARKGRAWGSLADAPPAIETAAAARLVVSGSADAHRSSPRLDATDDDDAVEEWRLLEAVDSIPDVLVAEAGTAEPNPARKWRRAAESPRESLDSAAAAAAASSGAPESHGRQKPPAKSSEWRGGARTTPATPVNVNPSLHFAPAGVLQLLGTAHCREFVEALPPASRARVLAVYDGFPDSTPPVGHLYVPLASPRSRADLPPPASGAARAPALLGALVHSLPAQAVRELLQVYVATTRAVGAVSVGGFAAGEGVGVTRRRTSGLLVLPPPPLPLLSPPSFLARGHPAASPARTAEVDGKEDDSVKGGRRSKSGPGGRPEGLPEQRRGNNGRKGVAGWLCVAATPPSAVDVLPDAPSSGDRGSSLGPPGRGTERQAPFRSDSLDDFIDGAVADDVLEGETSVGGRRAQTSAARMIGAGRGVNSLCTVVGVARTAEDAVISSSLQAPYHHAYVAVLAPPPPPTPSAVVNGTTGDGSVTGITNGNITGNGNINGNGTGSNASSAGNGAARVAAAAAGDSIDPFSNASALILQVERRGVREPPPRCDAVESSRRYGRTEEPDTTSGSGGCEGVVVMGDTRGQQEGACEMPPRVCGWRACLADAAAGSLCSAHEQVRDFLDGKAAKTGCVSDSFRFLPPGSGPKRRSSVRKRRAAASTPSWPSTSATPAGSTGVDSTAGSGSGGGGGGSGGGGGEGELIALRSMSPLLSELLNGKLGTTIAMFCQRAVAEAKTRRLSGRRASGKAGDELEGGGKNRQAVERRASGRGAIKTPEWARWADPEEAEAADRKVAADVRWAEQVLRAEKEVTLELRRLSNLGVYPEAELAHIRRQHAALATEWRQAIDGRAANAPGKGEEDEEDVGGEVPSGSSNSNSNNNNRNNHRNSTSNRSRNNNTGTVTGGEAPSLNSSCLPLPQLPPGSNQRARGETVIPARSAAGAPAPAPPFGSQPAQGGVRLSFETTSGSGTGTERYSGGGLCRRGKGSSAPAEVSREGRSDAGGVRGALEACGGWRDSAQTRGEEEIELEFSRLKWALLRRRREEVRGCRRGKRMYLPSPCCELDAWYHNKKSGDGGGGGGGGGGGNGEGGGGGGVGGGDLDDVAPAAGASMTPPSHFLAPHAEQFFGRPSATTSTLLPPRADKHSEPELQQLQQQQRRQQQHLLPSGAPAFSSSSSSSSCPPSSRRYRQLAALRRSSPPIRASRGTAAGPASGTSALVPTGRTIRAAAAAGSHAPGGKGERRKSMVGRSGGRAMLRKRASTGASSNGLGEGAGVSGAFQVDPFASRGGRRQGFDAAPYQTTVLFRDR
ncbi:unnamed protein product, partial [Laminaria digitata]